MPPFQQHIVIDNPQVTSQHCFQSVVEHPEVIPKIVALHPGIYKDLKAFLKSEMADILAKIQPLEDQMMDLKSKIDNTTRVRYSKRKALKSQHQSIARTVELYQQTAKMTLIAMMTLKSTYNNQ